jgi:phospholipase B1
MRYLVLLCCFVLTLSTEDAKGDYFFTEVMPTLIERAAANHQMEKMADVLTGMPFSCTQDLGPSEPAPTSVHKLRPGDISVVAALGDSITAAYGANATTILTDTVQYRGQSWAIGAQYVMEQLATMVNILAKFNTKKPVYGGSVGNGDQNNANSRLNVAVSGAIAADMPTQANALVQKLKTNPNVNFANDWKVVTIWIGGNDLCRFCNGNPEHTPAAYTSSIEQALTILFNEVPKVFVNMVQILDVSQLYNLHEGTCDMWHNQVCSCAAGSNSTTRSEAKTLATQYQNHIDAMVKQSKWGTKQDFAVVIQPFFVQTTLPLNSNGQPDRSYFAPDCFHFSTKAHEGVGIALWNNMIQPVGKKAQKWTAGEPPQCPTNAQPYLFTAVNSV